MIYFYIILYFIFLFFVYFFIIQRMKTLALRHKQNTWIKSLSDGYKIVRRRAVVLLLILFILGSLVLITFTKNDLLQESLIHTSEKTSNNVDF